MKWDNLHNKISVLLVKPMKINNKANNRLKLLMTFLFNTNNYQLAK